MVLSSRRSASMNRKARLAAVALGVAALALTVAGCAHRPHLAWPWHAKSAAAPHAVEAVVVRSQDGVTVRAFPQYWVRNALLIDLSGAAGTGTIVLTQRPGDAWPVRLAFRVRPAEIKMLEVSGVQRLVL